MTKHLERLLRACERAAAGRALLALHPALTLGLHAQELAVVTKHLERLLRACERATTARALLTLNLL